MDVPKHIGIILDGNRRYAKRLLLKPWQGHEKGAEKLEKLFDWCKELNIKELTLYTFSMQNFNRGKKEVDHLMRIFNREFERLLNDKRVHEDKVKIRFCGRLELFSKELREKMEKIMDMSKNYGNFIVNFCMAYGGREEIVDAAKKIALKVKKNEIDVDDIDEETFSKELYMDDEPELIIRTSGEYRTSNFLLFQGAFSEWAFPKILWPDFTKEKLIGIIKEFSKRERRFGK